jgi:hypothetical protein
MGVFEESSNCDGAASTPSITSDASLRNLCMLSRLRNMARLCSLAGGCIAGTCAEPESAHSVRSSASSSGEAGINTPAVARPTYIHPAVIDAFTDGTLPPEAILTAALQHDAEDVGLDFLEDAT